MTKMPIIKEFLQSYVENRPFLCSVALLIFIHLVNQCQSQHSSIVQGAMTRSQFVQSGYISAIGWINPYAVDKPVIQYIYPSIQSLNN